ncbi:hypothetical protein AOZ06_17010 [Kibdelosporangium phytohabitans]|uniref:Uncharacterized protein n=1 Tax=Kibdelosporangium phytohabitans TaxID=860235 RepID=A0A0N9I1S4_9PSEU|nr:hypothetical protein AOZ06_17010 [Kibdelosporangium phytohabitans]
MIAVRGTGQWWAWAASRVMPVGTRPGGGTGAPEPRSPGPTTVHIEHSGTARNIAQAGQIHGGVHFHDGDRPAPPPDDSAWLRSCWEIVARAGANAEMRYLSRPGESRLDGFLIVRAGGVDRDTAERQALAVRAGLGVLPSRLAAAPVTETALTHRVLEPFQPHSDGIVEVRKRLTAQRTSRDDARHPWLTAITPLTYQRQHWDSLWSELAGLPFPAMLSVGVAPYRIGPGLRSHLATRAADLARLARQGPPPTGVWSVPRPADEFAVTAHALVSDAARRYTDRAFLLRVSVAAEQPLAGLLGELVADTISARGDSHGFAAATPAVVRPEPMDVPTAWNNVTALNFAPLAAYDQGNAPEAIGDLERVLGSIVDLGEAAAAFRLPYRSAGKPSLFAVHPGR